ncbi:MAG: NADH:ubiquinone oxidoreductase [Synergistaceae bacterium]|jgi:multicomponent Na+:H+ antiporter subunit D|nr:NADH:ubiquinone oxidoreductase [Synergistaceae bacterium]
MKLHEHLPAFLVMVPLLGAFLTPLVASFGRVVRNVFFVFFSLLTLVIAVSIGMSVFGGQILVYVMGGENFALTLPSGMTYPVRILFEIDAFGALLILCIALAAFAGSVFSINYMDRFSGWKRFLSLYFLMTAGALGMCATGDLFNFFVFVEVSSIASFGLIAFWRDKPETIEASYKYMLVSQVAALLLLIAIGTLYGRYNALNMSALAAMARTGTLDRVVLALIISILAFKCGAFPMHAWMPDAYAETPSGVTCLLVTVSQASFYGLIRVCYSIFPGVAREGTVGWILIVLGCMSMFFGVMMAVVQHEIKRLMGYHSISQVGYMLLAMGVGLLALDGRGNAAAYGLTAMKGGLFHVMNYSIYKALLFLCAGSLYYATGTRDLDKMGGLARNMPWTTGMFVVAAAAISGLPPFNGFVSKLLIYESSFVVHPLLPAIAMITSVLTLASFVKVFQSAFLGPAKTKFIAVREVPAGMLTGMMVLTVVTLLLSLFPGWFMNNVFTKAAEALVDHEGYIRAVMGGGM